MNYFVLILKSLSATFRVVCVGYLLLFFSGGSTLVHLASERITGHHCCELNRGSLTSTESSASENCCTSIGRADADGNDLGCHGTKGASCHGAEGPALECFGECSAGNYVDPGQNTTINGKNIGNGKMTLSDCAWHSQDVCLICSLFSLPIAISTCELTPMAHSMEMLDICAVDEFGSSLILAYIARGPPAV